MQALINLDIFVGESVRGSDLIVDGKDVLMTGKGKDEHWQGSDGVRCEWHECFGLPTD